MEYDQKEPVIRALVGGASAIGSTQTMMEILALKAAKDLSVNMDVSGKAGTAKIK